MQEPRFPSVPAKKILTAAATFAVTFVTALSSFGAHAELGGTMPLQGNSGSAVPQTLAGGALRMRTVTDAGATTINEYATSTGLIVAYTWQGPTMPDLRALLGPYADSYRSGATLALASAPGGNLHASRVVRPDVVVESGGPMRGYMGRAWLPTALPPGVSSDDLH